MKTIKVVVAGVVLATGTSWGIGADNLFTVNNTIQLQWNDNYYQAPTNKTSTGIISEQPEITANYNRETTYIGVHYRPSFLWYLNSSIERQQTVQHELDANWNQTISSRLTLSLGETLRRGVSPEMLDRNNALVFPDQSYLENTLNGTAGIQLRESTRLDASGRYYLMRYDNITLATNQDYSMASGGLALRQDLSKSTTVSGSFNYDQVAYRAFSVRSSQTISIGGGVDHSFGPRLLGSLSGGYQLKSFDLTSINGQNSPYGNFSLTYLFDPRLRLSAGANYSLWEADISNYASQERLSAYASMGYDMTARINLYASGGVTRGQYHADQAVIQGPVQPLVDVNQTFATGQAPIDGVDTIYQFSARLSYQLDRHNSLNCGYGYTTVISALRSEFSQNTYDVSWRVTF